MVSSREEKKRRFIIDCLFIAIILAVAWFTLKYLLAWVLPFIIGYLIAAIVQPVAWLMHRKLHVGREFAGVFCVVVFVLLFVLLLTFGMSWLLHELASVAGMLPLLLQKFDASLSGITGRLNGMINELPIEISQQVNSAVVNMANELTRLSSLTTGAAAFAWSTVLKVPTVLISLLVTVVSACFISSDYPKIRGFFMRQLPEKYQSWAMDLKEFFFITIARLIRAYLTLMAITFTELCIGLGLMRVSHVVMIAALIAIVDILPILGTGTVLVPWAIIELVVGRQIFGLMLLLLYAIILVVRNILEPKIVGYHIGLYPLVTLIAMYVGLQAFGAVGLFTFPITVIVIKHMHDTGRLRLWKD
ncbi:MAG: sporulation integral membrane protein YtvI [Clostridia bacterium]|nr:sporulation integral membrane protein YtvI [Clostridia bacterium]